MLAAWLAWPTPVVVIREEGSGQLVARLAAASPLRMTYLHSLIKQPGEEEFQVEAGGLRLVRLASPSAAVLEYYARSEPIERDGDRYVVWVRGETPQALAVLASARGQRTVVVGEHRLPLHQLVPHGTPLRIGVEHWPRLLTWENGCAAEPASSGGASPPCRSGRGGNRCRCQRGGRRRRARGRVGRNGGG
ncbi:MAG: hypothetical protein KatS3mg061_3408 [Dehalococcoidia bacterium]|nr:MAG: hypothetical protein KatS3mg061_3408 [Dehalococcoidia bacterium]